MSYCAPQIWTLAILRQLCNNHKLCTFKPHTYDGIKINIMYNRYIHMYNNNIILCVLYTYNNNNLSILFEMEYDRGAKMNAQNMRTRTMCDDRFERNGLFIVFFICIKYIIGKNYAFICLVCEICILIHIALLRTYAHHEFDCCT